MKCSKMIDHMFTSSLLWNCKSFWFRPMINVIPSTKSSVVYPDVVSTLLSLQTSIIWTLLTGQFGVHLTSGFSVGEMIRTWFDQNESKSKNGKSMVHLCFLTCFTCRCFRLSLLKDSKVSAAGKPIVWCSQVRPMENQNLTGSFEF